MTAPQPAYKFISGPLAGTSRAKTNRGPAPVLLDADGGTLRASAAARIILVGQVYGQGVYRKMPAPRGSDIITYRWQPSA